MIVAVIAISLVIGFIIAAGVIGTQAQRLGRQRREPVWRLAEAADFVAQRLPFEAAASLRADELEALLRGHLNQLQFGPNDEDTAAFDDSDDEAASVTEDSFSAAQLYRTVRQGGLEVSLNDVVAVVAAHLDYLRLIGALSKVTDPSG